MAFCTLPPLRQRVQTYARWALPLRSTRTRWRLGLNRRFVATIEWLRLFPKPGFFPQIAHTFDMAAASLAEGWAPHPVMLPSFWVASTKRCKDAGSARAG